MSEDKEPVNFVTEMHRSIDGKTYKGPGRSQTHNTKVPDCHITIEGLDLPESLLETVSQTLGDFLSRLLNSVRLDLRPCSDDGLTTGAGDLVAIFSLAPFMFRFECAPAFPAGKFHINIAHGSTPTVDEQHPADSHSTGCTRSVAASTEQQAELYKQDSHDRLETSVSPFIKRLSDADLAAINAGAVPTSLMKLLGRVAYNEIERRRETDDA